MFLLIRKICLILLLPSFWGFACHVYSQDVIEYHAECATDLFFKKSLEKFRNSDQKLLEQEQKLQRLISTASFSSNREVFTIPTVIHVMHVGEGVGEGYNISDQQIQEALAHTNDMFRAQNGLLGPDIEIEFVLAQRTPDCQPTNGITRVDLSDNQAYVDGGISANGGPGVNEIEVKSRSVWPNDQYINIWVVNKIAGQDGTSGRFIAGYAYQAITDPDPIIDGVVLLASQMREDNETLGHELGHSFNLFHTFEGDGDGSVCPANDDCTLDGDRICDTDPHQRTNFNCNVDDVNSCTGSPFGLTITNHMDYSSCSERFTEGQKARMRATLLTTRSGLSSSQGASAPPNSLPTAACIPTIEPANDGNSFGIGPTRVKLSNLDYRSESYTTEGVYVDLVCQQVINVDVGTEYEIQVVTEVNPQKVRVFIDYNNDGDFDDNGEFVFASDESGAPQIHLGNITIPSAPPIVNQAVRMRVLADFTTGTDSPCGPLQFGQVEDYSIVINSQTANPPVIDNPTVASITQNSAVLGAEILDDGGAEITERGIVWSLNPFPVIGGTGVNTVTEGQTTIGIFTVQTNGLPDDTKIFFRGYATNALGTSYTEDFNFFTPIGSDIPIVDNLSISGITATSVNASAELLDQGNSEIIEKGFILSINPDPVLNQAGNIEVQVPGTELGVFTSIIQDLLEDTQIYIRAYATNSSGTGYSPTQEFFTPPIGSQPIIIEPAASDITFTSARLGANVTDNGGSDIVERGIIWSLSPDITFGVQGINVESAPIPDIGRFSIEVPNLPQEQTIYFVGYAINGTDTAYTVETSFVTQLGPQVPSLTYNETNLRSFSSAELVAQITSDGGSTITESGFVISEVPSPVKDDPSAITISLTITTLGEFNHILEGLSSNTNYYVRAFAVNSTGIGYSNESTFTTLADGLTQIFNFSGEAIQTGVRLSWEAIEVNSASFVVERSLDSLFFSTTTELAGQGTVTETTNYEVLDKPTDPGKLFYRIKAVGVDGSQVFSEIITITFNSFTDFLVFPNPIDDQIQVDIPYLFTQAANLVVVDAAGRILYNEIISAQQGESITITVNTIKWPKGMYFATLFDGPQVNMQRIVKF